jgi:hypothetical protein
VSAGDTLREHDIPREQMASEESADTTDGQRPTAKSYNSYIIYIMRTVEPLWQALLSFRLRCAYGPQTTIETAKGRPYSMPTLTRLIAPTP